MELTSENERKLQDLIVSGYTFNRKQYWNEGAQRWRELMWPFAGFFGLYLGAMIIGGGLAGILAGPPLIAGAFLVARKLKRNQYTEFGNFFDGFKWFGQLVLLNLVQGLIAAAVLIAVLLPVIVSIIFLAQSWADAPPQPATVLSLIIFAVVLAIVPVAYFSVAYLFSMQLVIFGGLKFWPAMELSRKLTMQQFWPILGMMVLLGLLNFAAALPCYIGLLFSMPLTYCIINAAYENIITPVLEGEEGYGMDLTDHLISED